ncbi:hypothetical protein VTN77DRAFT_1888 [Rasamsonia byssochlamydoides]|uniref:uncharacterized protein n=1 Tax=Rasamsonia byssochlamydoides TaxID=89139 RepID=UPI003744631D
MSALRLLTGGRRAYETPSCWKFSCTTAADWTAATNRMRHRDAVTQDANRLAGHLGIASHWRQVSSHPHVVSTTIFARPRSRRYRCCLPRALVPQSNAFRSTRFILFRNGTSLNALSSRQGIYKRSSRESQLLTVS